MRIFCLAIIFLSLSFGTQKLEAQEVGPKVMSYEAGYTAYGAVAGAGIGAVLFIMDPLNPDIEFRNLIFDGLAVGIFVGSMLGFYMIQNAVVDPPQRTNFEDLLGELNRDQEQIHGSHAKLTIPLTWKF